MFAKSSVSGADANPLFKLLIEKSGTKPRWNFYKYLIDRQGNVVNAYSSMTSPSSKSLIKDIEKIL
jgi:glutathione peroxidase